MIPGIDPKVDYAFKKVFGSESNVDLLQHLLEAMLGFALSAVEIVNPFNDKDASDDKLSVLDIKARDAEGRWFDVEMQMSLHAALVPRLLYYWAKLYSGQLAAGQDFGDLRPAYSSCFLRGRLFPGREAVYHNHFELVDRNTGEVPSDHFGLHVVELPKFSLTAEELMTDEEVWCYFLTHAEALDTDKMPATMNEPAVMKAMEVLMHLSQSEIERERYESRLKWERDQRQREHDRQASVKEALEAGRKEGLKEGLNEGRTEGRKEGLNEGLERGALYGRIRAFQTLLNQTETPKPELDALSSNELQRLADELQQRIISGK